MTVSIKVGDCLEVLASLPAESVHCCVTSPPYWRKRDYGCDGQIGMEPTPEDFIRRLVPVFDEVRRVTVPDGVCWINIGDSYASGGNGGGGSLSRSRKSYRAQAGKTGWRKAPPGYKDRDLVMIPAMLAMTLRDSGWFLRQSIVWSKPRADEPVRRDRPSTSHEYLFLLSKSKSSRSRDPGEKWWQSNVWNVAPSPGIDGHGAPMPNEIARRCIVSSTGAGDTVLDPFGGAGTTGLVADRLGRSAILIELNPEYADMARDRIRGDAPLFAEVEA